MMLRWIFLSLEPFPFHFHSMAKLDKFSNGKAEYVQSCRTVRIIKFFWRRVRRRISFVTPHSENGVCNSFTSHAQSWHYYVNIRMRCAKQSTYTIHIRTKISLFVFFLSLSLFGNMNIWLFVHVWVILILCLLNNMTTTTTTTTTQQWQWA